MLLKRSCPLTRIPLNSSVLVLIVALCFLSAPLHAQTDSSPDTTISTDRPAVSSSSVVVPQGGFQVENGLLVNSTAGNSVLDLPESNLRYGLLQKTELRFTVPDF